MSRGKHFVNGLGLLLLSAVWCFFCFVVFIGNAVGRDSVPGASAHDSSFMAIYLIGGGGLLCGLFFAFRSFGRALQSPRSASPPQTLSQPAAQDPQQDARTSEERLAHLVKKK